MEMDRKIMPQDFQEKQIWEPMTQKDSRGVVLLRHHQQIPVWWEEIWLQLPCSLLAVRWDGEKNQEEVLRQARPDFLVAAGEEQELLRICGMRRTLEGGKPPVLFFLREPPVLLRKMLLWVRDRSGNTVYLGRQQWGQYDALVIPEERGKSGERHDWMIFPAEKGWGEERFLWEELAEPLQICLDIPLQRGIDLARRFLETGRVCPDEIWVPAARVELLTEMAMAGIEMLPGQGLSRQQVRSFYMRLCRSRLFFEGSNM